ncbi:transmembrane protein 120B isoform X2 [Gadus morhua]|uniref:transmembrane protein 120B isoform X2 n=1 Tax=Gadus morhua TaxID=8049 RepID=UPI0011B7F1E2|nr:transmembrane protein 120B-like isoform X2 [Gadus morhua]
MSFPRLQTEWDEIELEYQQLQETHKVYRQKLEELTSLQSTCSSGISKQRKSLKDIRHSLNKSIPKCDEKELEVLKDIKIQIIEKENVFFEMESYLPKKNGLYLSLVLGNVNVTLLSNQAKFAYKDEYEKFKVFMTIILLFGAITCLFFLNYRVTDELFNFLLVWYYCTLTIRESILMCNGSRIKGWWVSHHYVSTFLSGVMLTWPEGQMYQMFRSQFLAFSIYQSFVQFLQYYYQSGCLYRLRALGERNQLDLTRASSLGCGEDSLLSCLSFFLAIFGSSTTRSLCFAWQDMKTVRSGRYSCWASPSLCCSRVISSPL